MAKKFNNYLYKDKRIGKAFLYNLRDDDAVKGGFIKRGDIVFGKCGIHIAEADVNGFSARQTIAFAPNRQCEWEGFILDAHTLDGLPKGPVPRGPKGKLRHRHCVVALLPSGQEVKRAQQLGLPIIKDSFGNDLINLEVASIPQRQPPERRAKLL